MTTNDEMDLGAAALAHEARHELVTLRGWRLERRLLVQGRRTMLGGMLKAGFLLALLTMPALGACRTSSAPAKAAGNAPSAICQIAQLPPTTAGRRVTLQAEFITDRRERSFLQDQRCPDIIVVPYETAGILRDSGYEAFSRIVDADPFSPELVTANVTVYGIIRPISPRRYRLDIIRYIETSGR